MTLLQNYGLYLIVPFSISLASLTSLDRANPTEILSMEPYMRKPTPLRGRRP